MNRSTVVLDVCMSGKKSAKNQKPKRELEKTHWNLYSLQKLSIGKFAKIINKVLNNENMLVK